MRRPVRKLKIDLEVISALAVELWLMFLFTACTFFLSTPLSCLAVMGTTIIGYYRISRVIRLPKMSVNEDGIKIDKVHYPWQEVKEVGTNCFTLDQGYGLRISLRNGTDLFFSSNIYSNTDVMQTYILNIITTHDQRTIKIVEERIDDPSDREMNYDGG